MCLSSLAPELISGLEPMTETVGWKVFRKNIYGGGMFSLRNPRDHKPYLVGVWLEASLGTILIGNGESYPTGFHCLKDKSDAEALHQFHLRARETSIEEGRALPFAPSLATKVLVRKLVAAGYGDGYQNYDAACYVAKEMMILPRESGDAQSA